jgi:hypothetical protein
LTTTGDELHVLGEALADAGLDGEVLAVAVADGLGAGVGLLEQAAMTGMDTTIRAASTPVLAFMIATVPSGQSTSRHWSSPEGCHRPRSRQ